MAPQIALLVYAVFIVLLFRHGVRRGWSENLWVPFIWVFIVGSKPIGLWLAILTGTVRSPEGSNLDTAIFLGLLALSFRLLAKRRTNWVAVRAKNKWLILYFAYAAVSIFWAEYPYSALKLWVKDAGNLIIVLALLSEQPQGAGLKVTLARIGYFLVPLSTLLVKYFPDIGRGYDPWVWEPLMLGASESKNALGATTAVCGIGLVWSLIDRERGERRTWTQFGLAGLILMMCVWLLLSSHCATALACALLAVTLFILLRRKGTRLMVANVSLLSVCLLVAALVVVDVFFDVRTTAAGALGRDTTLTGRTPIWNASLSEDINPFFGCGYSSFWRSIHGYNVSHSLGFYFTLKEAHDGYIETYLSGGLVGLGILFIAIGASLRRAVRNLKTPSSYAVLRVVCIIVPLIYNVTESAFAGLNSMWFLLLCGLAEYPIRAGRAVEPRRIPVSHPALQELAPA